MTGDTKCCFYFEKNVFIIFLNISIVQLMKLKKRIIYFLNTGNPCTSQTFLNHTNTILIDRFSISFKY